MMYLIKHTNKRIGWLELTENDIDFDKNKLTGKCQKTGEFKTFSLDSLLNKKFFKEVPDDLFTAITDLSEQKKRLHDKHMKEKLEELNKKRVYNLDEHKKQISKQNWQHMYDVAETERAYHESRAVVYDDDLIFINASALLVYLEDNPKSGDKIYKYCEGYERAKKYHKTCHVRYATKEELREFCLKHTDTVLEDK